MPQKEWSITLNNTKHTLTLNHGSLQRKYDLKLDGNRLNPVRELIEKGDKLAFNINTHTCIVIIKLYKGDFEYDCIVDAHSVETGQRIEIPPRWTPPKEGCLKYVIYWLLWAVTVSLMSLITGLSEGKIDQTITLIIITLIISPIILRLWKNR